MLTKSDFIKFLQCQKYLWLYKKRKDLLPLEISADQAALFEGGFEVEKFAYRLFPDGESAAAGGFNEAVDKTTKLIKQRAQVIYQPTFSNRESGLFCRADIIVRNRRSGYDIFEVKSSTEVKDVHLSDVAFQKICLDDAGLKVGKVSVVYVNNTYVRHGEIEPDKLLIIEDVTDKVDEMLAGKREEIAAALKTLKMKKEPDVRILKQCSDPYDCPFIDYCWREVPEDSIYGVSITKDNLNQLLDDGIIKIEDVPATMISRTLQKSYQEALKTNRVHIDKRAILEWLGELVGPIYFLDYETWSSAVPAFDGYRPYQQIPFQYSLYSQAKPGAALVHREFLATTSGDPVPSLAKSLLENIGTQGSIITWNMSFEKARNREMGERLPRYAKAMAALNDRIVDLGKPFADGHYVHKGFQGSWSIKKVLPVLVPNLSYESLEIQNGGMASSSWPVLVGDTLTPAEKQKLTDDMLAYCGLDTMAMVRILEVLQKAAKGKG